MGRIWKVWGMGSHNTNILYEKSIFSVKSISSFINKMKTTTTKKNSISSTLIGAHCQGNATHVASVSARTHTQTHNYT